MTTATYNQIIEQELECLKFEQDCQRFDDYSQNTIQVWGSRAQLLLLWEVLNEDYGLSISKHDIQDVGIEYMMSFTINEDF